MNVVIKVFLIIVSLAGLTAIATACVLGGNYLLTNLLHIHGWLLNVLQFILIVFVIFPAKFFFALVREILFPDDEVGNQLHD